MPSLETYIVISLDHPLPGKMFLSAHGLCLLSWNKITCTSVCRSLSASDMSDVWSLCVWNRKWF